MRAIYYYPTKKLMAIIPLVLVIAVVVGMLFDTSWMASTILIATMMMIYPMMIGFQWKALFNLTEKKVISYAMLINFVFIPIVALILGYIFLKNEPILFAGLALAALLPTSGMTISWTAISKGNVSAAVKLTVFGLIAGAILAPLYLWGMVGQFVDIQLIAIMRTILAVVFIPLILGILTTRMFKKRWKLEEINKKIKPVFQPLSLWAMLYIIFASISMRAEMIIENWMMIGVSVIVLLLFYTIVFSFVTWIASRSFSREDGLSLVYGTTLRNLSIAMGIGASSFGLEAALFVTIAFMIQQQGVVLYNRFIVPKFFKENEAVSIQNQQQLIKEN